MSRKIKTLKELKTTQVLNLINTAYNSKNYNQIKKLENKINIDLISSALEQIDDYEIIVFVLMILDDYKTRIIFKNLPEEDQLSILNNATNLQLKNILKSLYADDVVDILKENNETINKKLILCLPSDTKQQIKEIYSFDEDEVGSIMNPEFISFFEKMSIKECLNKYKRNYNNIEKNSTFFIVDKDNHLIGKIDLEALIFANNENNEVKSITEKNIISVKANDDIETSVDIFQDYLIELLPVVNENNVLVGVISQNDILPAIEEETTEDIYNMYGISELQKSYFKSSIWSIVKSRIFWLIILMIAGTLTSIVIDQFQDLGETLTSGISTLLLVPIIPVITGTSGNAGSQSVASVVRALAIGDVTKKEYSKVIKKEFLVGLLLGLFLAIVNFARLCVYFAIPAFRPDINSLQNINLKINNQYGLCAIISLIVSASLWIAIIFSKLLGTILPLIAVKFNKDPTVMSAPLIATIVDIASTSILFGLGILVLHFCIGG